jgi:hypothetical protein
MTGLRRYLVVSAILLVGYLIAQYYRPEPTNWNPSYLREDKIPFGLYILHQEIHDLFPDAEITIAKQRIYNVLKGKKEEGSNYLFVASDIDADKLDLKELLDFISKGNHVFMATFKLSDELSDSLKVETSSAVDYRRKLSLPINFVNPELRAKKDYVFNRGLGDQYFSKFDTARVTVLGKNSSGDANFIKYTFGKGSLYLLPNPQLLTNYSLLNPAGAEYAAKALSYLPTSKTLIWDEFNTRPDEKDRSELRVIFANERLRWAYYIALFSLVTFVLFEMKRRQRVIPVIEPLKNSSVDFVKVVGQVYYQQRNNQDIAIKKVNYLLEYIRSTYHLKTTVLDAELEENLSIRTGADKETVNQLFNAIKRINSNTGVDDTLLINFNKLIEQFYKQAK